VKEIETKTLGETRLSQGASYPLEKVQEIAFASSRLLRDTLSARTPDLDRAATWAQEQGVNAP